MTAVIQLGAELTRGLGAGTNPEVGREAAEENTDIIRDVLEGANMLFLTAGGNNFWLGIIINESTCFSKSAIPASATSFFLVPSKSNGLVTTATVRMYCRFREACRLIDYYS
jgi:hypothetical protein